jgi:vanillate O-demethylase monooxygenase subunit
MALSQGCVKGNAIQCGYHGMEFDGSGRCVKIPSQDLIPSQMRVRSYPLQERSIHVWAWMGDPAKADPALIPDHGKFGMLDPSFEVQQHFLMPIDASYQLLHENLLDVSHISFLHEGMFDSGAICKVTPEIVREGNMIRVTRKVTETMYGVYAQVFGFEDGMTIERTLISESYAPGLNVITNIFRRPGDPDGKPMIMYSPFPLTPATETSCYQFASSVQNYREPISAEQAAARTQQLWDVFLTDKAATESIQMSYDEQGADAADCSVRADEGALRFRRIIAEQAEAERVG